MNHTTVGMQVMSPNLEAVFTYKIHIYMNNRYKEEMLNPNQSSQGDDVHVFVWSLRDWGLLECLYSGLTLPSAAWAGEVQPLPGFPKASALR